MAVPNPTQGATFRPRHILAYIFVAGAILALLFFFPSGENVIDHPVLSQSKPIPGLTLLAYLESNDHYSTHDVKISFEAASDPGTRVDQMVVCVTAPDSTFNPASLCQPVNVFDKGDVHQTRTPTSLHLVRLRSTGSVRLLLVVNWRRFVLPPSSRTPSDASATQSKGNTTPPDVSVCALNSTSCIPLFEKSVMTVGPVQLGPNRLSRFSGRLSRFLKDFTLPIILIFLANWLASVTAGRDRRREEIERAVREEKEAKQREDDEERRNLERKQEQERHDFEREEEEERQTAHILLPKVMRLAGHFYLPLTLHSTRFVRISTNGRTNSHELTFELLSFFHVARALREQEGGVFFKDLAAESMFVIANNLVRELAVVGAGGEKPFMECLNQLDTWIPEGPRRWPRLSDEPSSLTPAWLAVEQWINMVEEEPFQAMRYLFNILAATLRYESNAPYRHWYHNSSRENLFRLVATDIPIPRSEVFGAGERSMQMAEFQELAAQYRRGREQ